MGPTALLPFRRKSSYSGFLRSEKIHRPRPGSNNFNKSFETHYLLKLGSRSEASGNVASKIKYWKTDNIHWPYHCFIRMCTGTSGISRSYAYEYGDKLSRKSRIIPGFTFHYGVPEKYIFFCHFASPSDVLLVNVLWFIVFVTLLLHKILQVPVTWSIAVA